VNQPRVFIVQDPKGKDMSTAREFGELTVLFPARASDGSAKDFLNMADALLDEHDVKEHDYLILLGDPALVGAVMVAAYARFTHLNLLRWDREHYRYFPDSTAAVEN